MSSAKVIWLCIGFGGQAAFSARFLVQWLASEKKGESTIPIAFWYLSLVGGGTLLSYAVFHLHDPVIITGQLFGVIVYARNLVLIYRQRSEERSRRVSEHPSLLSVVQPEAALRKAG